MANNRNFMCKTCTKKARAPKGRPPTCPHCRRPMFLENEPSKRGRRYVKTYVKKA